jgi:hypothetical protein
MRSYQLPAHSVDRVPELLCEVGRASRITEDRGGATATVNLDPGDPDRVHSAAMHLRASRER